jgi:hypothetical protein
MYQTSLFFKIKDTATQEKHKIVEIFFKSWVDGICNNEVDYTLTDVLEAPLNSVRWEEIYRVDFERTEDAVALKLKGIPPEYQNYVELV